MSRAENLFGQKIPQYSHNVNLYEQYAQMVMVNTIGNTYYMSSRDLFNKSIELHEEMLCTSPSFMMQAIIYARNNGLMRLQPIMGLAYLSTIGDKDFFYKAFNNVIITPGDLIDFITIVSSIRKGLGRSVKKGINNWLTNNKVDGLTEYHAIKYGGGDGKGKWTLKDIIKVSHPTPKTPQQSSLFRYLTTGKIDNKDLNQVIAIEAMKKVSNERSNYSNEDFNWIIIKLIQEGRLPYEIVTGIIEPTIEIWEHLMREMPIFALVRHLNTLEREGVFKKEGNINFVVEKLTNSEIIKRSKILPFRFLTAYNALETNNLKLKVALEKALDLSIATYVELPGNNAFFMDISGSMEGEFKDIGSILGLAALKKSQSASFYLFGSYLHYFEMDPQKSIIKNANIIDKIYGGGTNIGLCIEHLLGEIGNIKNSSYSRSGTYNKNFPGDKKTTEPIFVDNIIILTDEKQNSGSPIIRKFRKYRELVNPNAKLFIIDIAPYSSHISNSEEPGVTFIYGWSDSVLDVLEFTLKGLGSHIDQIKSYNRT